MVLAIGFFDGVHLGHRAILRGADAALTFRNHPLSVLAPDRAPRLLMTTAARLKAIRACGVREVTALDFTADYAAQTATDFMRTLPKGVRIRCGENWRFGRGGTGDAAWLRANGVAVDVVPSAVLDGALISSTRIRTALETGHPEAATAMLGRPFRTAGIGFKGKGLGKTIGYPTVNLKLDDLALNMPYGVYEVRIGLPNGVSRHAIANYGIAPTLGDGAWSAPVLEAHILDGAAGAWDEWRAKGDGEARGDGDVTVDFLRFMRPERTFASVDALVAQIAADVAALTGACS